MKRFHFIGLFLSMALIIGVTFSSVFEAGFLYWDDNHNVYENQRVQNLSGENLKWMFTSVGPDIRYKPLTWLAWATIDAGFGQSPRAFHIANLILHTLNAWLLVCVLLAFGKRVRPADGEESNLLWLAGGVSLLWALHPLRVEPVAWISCLAHGLCFFFCLLSVGSFLKIDFERSVWRQGSYWSAVACFLIALLSFPLPLGFGATFFALNIFPLRRVKVTGFRELFRRENLRVYGELLPFLAVSILAVIQQLYFRWQVQGTFGEAVTMQEFPLIDRVTQAAYVWMHYPWKTVLPLDLTPVDLVLTKYSGFDWPMIVTLLALVGMVVLAFCWRVRWPGILALIVAHLGVLVPVLGLTERPHFPGDRYAHIDGAILMAGLFGWLWAAGPKWRSSMVAVGGGVLGVVLAAMSFTQSLIWLNDRTLFTHQVEHLDDGAQRGSAMVRLAWSYLDEGDGVRAMKLFDEAQQIHPGYAEIDLYLPYGGLLETVSDSRGAARQYQHAIRVKPSHPEAWKRLAGIFLREG
ncbi:MAG: tetratricopeptide repeat protein, partial [Limisphaerales bacterium]